MNDGSRPQTVGGPGWAASQRLGDREVQEDTFWVEPPRIWAVFDGMDGNGNGLPRYLAALERAWDGSASTVTAKLSALKTVVPTGGAGVVLAMLSFEGQQVHVGWIGDCRVYRIRGTTCQRLTRDQNLCNYWVDKIEATEAKGRRLAWHRNVLVGTLYPSASNLVPPGYKTFQRQAGDRFVVCTDGAYRSISDTQLFALQAGRSAAEAVEALLDQAMQLNATDNATVIVVDEHNLKPWPAEIPDAVRALRGPPRKDLPPYDPDAKPSVQRAKVAPLVGRDAPRTHDELDSHSDSLVIERHGRELETPGMNKQDLVSSVADRSGLSNTDAAKAVEAVLDSITEALRCGEELHLVGFGTFSTLRRNASTGRNPRTGEAMRIPASVRAKFEAERALNDSINGPLPSKIPDAARALRGPPRRDLPPYNPYPEPTGNPRPHAAPTRNAPAPTNPVSQEEVRAMLRNLTPRTLDELRALDELKSGSDGQED